MEKINMARLWEEHTIGNPEGDPPTHFQITEEQARDIFRQEYHPKNWTPEEWEEQADSSINHGHFRFGPFTFEIIEDAA